VESACIRIGAMLRFAPNSVRAWLKRRAGERDLAIGRASCEKHEVLGEVEGCGWALARSRRHPAGRSAMPR